MTLTDRYFTARANAEKVSAADKLRKLTAARPPPPAPPKKDP